MKIGFIGLGIMGSRMAAHLQATEHELIVYNRTESKAQQLLENGANWGNSPGEVAKNCDLLITMLAHPEAIKDIAYGIDNIPFKMIIAIFPKIGPFITWLFNQYLNLNHIPRIFMGLVDMWNLSNFPCSFLLAPSPVISVFASFKTVQRVFQIFPVVLAVVSTIACSV